MLNRTRHDSGRRHFPPAAGWSICLLLVLLAGCANLNDTRFANLLGTEQNLIQVAYRMAEDLERQAFPPLPRHPDRPILTTTFVNNNNLEETSQFSRILQEHMASRFVQMGFSVREIKLRDELRIEPLQGEKMLSRNIRDIQASQSAQAISIGTYSLADSAIYLSARMVDPDTATIISSVDYKLKMDDNMLAMFGRRPKGTSSIDPIEEPRPSFITRLLY